MNVYAFQSLPFIRLGLPVLLLVGLVAVTQLPADQAEEKSAAKPAAAKDSATDKWSGATGKPAAPPKMPVTVSKVVQKQLQKQLWFSGSIISRQRASLAAESPGRVITVAEVGDRFKTDEIIAQFDDTLLQKTLLEYQATGASRRSQIQFLQNEVNRLRALAKDNNAAISKLEETQATLEMEHGALAVNTARLEQTEEKIRRMRIVAPFAGIISERYAELGEWVKEGNPVVKIVNPDDLEIKTSVSEQVLPFINSDSRLTVMIGQQQHTVKIRSIVPVGDSQSRLFELRLETPPAVGRPQQLTRVAAPISSAHDGLVVPEDALIIRHDGISVFTVTSDMTAHRVPVRLGITDNNGWIEVSGALQAGDSVVIRGGERLREGMNVRTVSMSTQQ